MNSILVPFDTIVQPSKMSPHQLSTNNQSNFDDLEMNFHFSFNQHQQQQHQQQNHQIKLNNINNNINSSSSSEEEEEEEEEEVVEEEKEKNNNNLESKNNNTNQGIDLSDSDDESMDESEESDSSNGEESDLDDSNESEDDSDSDSDQDDFYNSPQYNLRKSNGSILCKRSLGQDTDDEEEEEEEDDEEYDDSDFSDSDRNDVHDNDLSGLEDFIDLLPPTSFSIEYNQYNHSPVRKSPSPNQFFVDTDDEQLNNDQDLDLDQEDDQPCHTTIKVTEALRTSLENVRNGERECPTLPFWFNNQDPDHLAVIFEAYAAHLHLDKEIRQIKRAPRPFVGRVHCRVLPNNQKGSFATIDRVKVYRWDVQPIGRPLLSSRSVMLLTNWDIESGLPTDFKSLSSLSLKEYWVMMQESKGLLQQSYLYCSPIFDSIYQYQYNVSIDKFPIDYLQASKSKQQQQQLSPIPIHVGGGGNSRPISPSLIMSSHIYSHSLIPQHLFSPKDISNDDS